MSVFEMDAARQEKQAELQRLIARRDVLANEIKRCKESGPLMSSLCKEFTAVKKQIQIVRGC